MRKRQKNIAWMVACGMMSKAEAARKLGVHTNNVDRLLFNGLVEELKDRNILNHE